MAVQVTEVQKALKGADYPASREDLVSLAERNGADPELVDLLRNMNEDEFEGPNGVMKELRGQLGGQTE